MRFGRRRAAGGGCHASRRAARAAKQCVWLLGNRLLDGCFFRVFQQWAVPASGAGWPHDADGPSATLHPRRGSGLDPAECDPRKRLAEEPEQIGAHALLEMGSLPGTEGKQSPPAQVAAEHANECLGPYCS